MGNQVMAVFTLDNTDPADVFVGWYNPDVDWIPAFERSVAERVIAYIARQYEDNPFAYDSFEWDGDVLVQFNRNDAGLVRATTRIEPDAEGRYAIGDGWTWNTVETKDPTNDERASWAMVALLAFAEETGQSADSSHAELEETLTDLLSDLHHLADQQGIDWNDVTSSADLHYSDES